MTPPRKPLLKLPIVLVLTPDDLPDVSLIAAALHEAWIEEGPFHIAYRWPSGDAPDAIDAWAAAHRVETIRHIAEPIIPRPECDAHNRMTAAGGILTLAVSHRVDPLIEQGIRAAKRHKIPYCRYGHNAPPNKPSPAIPTPTPATVRTPPCCLCNTDGCRQDACEPTCPLCNNTCPSPHDCCTTPSHLDRFLTEGLRR